MCIVVERGCLVQDVSYDKSKTILPAVFSVQSVVLDCIDSGSLLSFLFCQIR